MLVKSLSLFALAASALALPALPQPRDRDWGKWNNGGKWRGGKWAGKQSTDVVTPAAAPSASLTVDNLSYAVAADDDDEDWDDYEDEEEEELKCPLNNKAAATATKTWNTHATTSAAAWSAPASAAPTTTTLEHPVPSAEASATESKDESNDNLGADLHAQHDEPTTTSKWEAPKTTEAPAPEPTPEAKQEENNNNNNGNNNNSGGGSGPGEAVKQGQATFYSVEDPAENHGYAPGTVACPGGTYNNGQDIVAISHENWDAWGQDAVCGRTVHITNKKTGQSTEATVVDRCAGGGCPWNALDLTNNLFAKIGNPNDGILQIEWYFV